MLKIDEVRSYCIHILILVIFHPIAIPTGSWFLHSIGLAILKFDVFPLGLETKGLGLRHCYLLKVLRKCKKVGIARLVVCSCDVFVPSFIGPMDIYSKKIFLDNQASDSPLLKNCLVLFLHSNLLGVT